VHFHALGITGGLERARVKGLQNVQFFVVVAGLFFHDLFLYCRVAFRLGMMVLRKISDSVSMNGTAYT
jgi:hypothetical protein